MTASNAYEAFAQIAQDNFVNEACARIIIRGDKYRPIRYAPTVRCPVLLQICEKDQLVSVESIEETGRILGQRAEIRRYPIGHFDVYFGKNHETSVRDQIEFFKKHLGVRSGNGTTRRSSRSLTLRRNFMLAKFFTIRNLFLAAVSSKKDVFLRRVF